MRSIIQNKQAISVPRVFHLLYLLPTLLVGALLLVAGCGEEKDEKEENHGK